MISVIGQARGSARAVADANGWVRPSDWLAIPEIAAGEQKAVLLLAVTDDDSNYVALLCRGAYTVDWGDGSAPENVADNTRAEHKFSYSALNASSASAYGYRQALITVTPQSGNDLTTFSLQQKHSRAGITSASHLIDVVASLGRATSILIGGSTVGHGQLERIRILELGAVSSYNLLVWGCQSIRSVLLPSGVPVTSASSMAYTAYALVAAPIFDSVGVTTFSTAFANCISLRTVPALDWSAVTTATNAFLGCVALSKVKVTNIGCTISFAGCRLARQEILEIFGNLKSGVTGKTITLTGNHGVADLTAGDIAIATAKGWTVVT